MKLLSSMVLALCLSTGAYASKFDDLTIDAELGDAAAQHSLGLMYDRENDENGRYAEVLKSFFVEEYGVYVPPNYKEAIKWYTLSAEQGYAAAQHSLGLMYETGRGVPQSSKEALKWYTLAAE